MLQNRSMVFIEPLKDVHLPFLAARGAVEADQDARGAEGVNVAVNNGRRGPRSRTPKWIVQARFDLPVPHFAAGVRVIANHRLHRTALLLREKEVPRDREGRPRWANWDFPQLSRRLDGPVSGDLRTSRTSRALSAAEARPFGIRERLAHHGRVQAIGLGGPGRRF